MHVSRNSNDYNLLMPKKYTDVKNDVLMPDLKPITQIRIFVVAFARSDDLKFRSQFLTAPWMCSQTHADT